MKMKILFCNIAYMQYYDNRICDIPINGGAYVHKHNDAFEKYNFQECDDGFYRGFVETKHKKCYEYGNQTNTYNSLHIEKIDKECKDKDYIDNVLVVFCAKPENKSTVIVGWYKNARVYRNRPMYNGRIFNLEARKSDCVLLDVPSREFVIPRAKKGVFGIGQSNVRFADFENHSEFMEKVISYIYGNDYVSVTDQEIVEENQEFIENGKGKKIVINTYERNPKARKACLIHYGYKCAICGFDAKEVYGDGYDGKIEVHHVTPIHEIGNEYQVDPIKDLIPICPNCHMILHSKSKTTGKYISVQELKELFNKKQANK